MDPVEFIIITIMWPLSPALLQGWVTPDRSPVQVRALIDVVPAFSAGVFALREAAASIL